VSNNLFLYKKHQTFATQDKEYLMYFICFNITELKSTEFSDFVNFEMFTYGIWVYFLVSWKFFDLFSMFYTFYIFVERVF